MGSFLLNLLCGRDLVMQSNGSTSFDANGTLLISKAMCLNM